MRMTSGAQGPFLQKQVILHDQNWTETYRKTNTCLYHCSKMSCTTSLILILAVVSKIIKDLVIVKLFYL